jgi:hypothetical protein
MKKKFISLKFHGRPLPGVALEWTLNRPMKDVVGAFARLGIVCFVESKRNMTGQRPCRAKRDQEQERRENSQIQLGAWA